MEMMENITTVRQEMMTAASTTIFMVTNIMMAMTVLTGVPTMVTARAGSTSTVKTFFFAGELVKLEAATSVEAAVVLTGTLVTALEEETTPLEAVLQAAEKTVEVRSNMREVCMKRGRQMRKG